MNVKKTFFKSLLFTSLILVVFGLSVQVSKNIFISSANISGGVSILHEETITGGSRRSQIVTTSGNVTAVANDLYLASVSSLKSAEVLSITGLGLNWTEIRYQCSGRNVTQVSVWMAQGSPTISEPVTATLAKSSKSAVIAISRYSGVDNSNPIGAIVSANTNGVDGECSGGTDGRNSEADITTQNNDAYIYGAISLRGKSFTPLNSFTERTEIKSGSGGKAAGLAIEDQEVGINTLSVGGTLSSSSDWSMVAVEIVPKTSNIPPIPTITLTATPTNVDSGESSVLSWSSTDTTDCTASGDWAGVKATSGSETFTNLIAESTYSLTCNGVGDSVSESVTVGI